MQLYAKILQYEKRTNKNNQFLTFTFYYLGVPLQVRLCAAIFLFTAKLYSGKPFKTKKISAAILHAKQPLSISNLFN